MRHSSTLAIFLIAQLLACLVRADSSAADKGNLLRNGGAEQGKDDQPSIWYQAKSEAKGLRMWRDTTQSHSGKASLAISNDHEYPEPVANNWAQQLEDIPAGKTVVLKAYIKTASADAVNVCLQCWDKEGNVLLAYASTPAIRGDQDWAVFKSRPVTIPEDTALAVVRAALTGKGSAWFDDITTEVVAPIVSPTAETATGLVDSDLAKAVKGTVRAVHPVAKDVMILKYMPEWAHGELDNIAVANNEGGVRTLLAWTPLAAEQSKAPNTRFLLALYARESKSGPEPGELAVYAIQSSWPESTCWNTQPKAAEEPAGKFRFVSEEGWRVFDVTELARAQAAEPAKVQGVMLRFLREDRPADSLSSYAFVSREGLGEWKSRRPVLLTVESAGDEDSKDARQGREGGR